MRRRPPGACELELTAGWRRCAISTRRINVPEDELMEQLMAMKGKHDAEMQALRLSRELAA